MVMIIENLKGEIIQIYLSACILYCHAFVCLIAGKRLVKLEICMTHKQNDNGNQKASKRGLSSVLELRLDVLRKMIATSESGIFPHAVLSTQQIVLLSTQKPTSMPEVLLFYLFYLRPKFDWKHADYLFILKLLQLEKLIGKLKAEKYGSRIIESIQNYVKGEQPNCKVTIADQGNENECIKRRRKNKSPVIIESSEDETD